MLVSASRATPLPSDQLHMAAEDRGIVRRGKALHSFAGSGRPVRLVPLQTFRPLDVCFCIAAPLDAQDMPNQASTDGLVRNLPLGA